MKGYEIGINDERKRVLRIIRGDRYIGTNLTPAQTLNEYMKQLIKEIKKNGN